MEERLRKSEDSALISAEIHRLMEETQRRMEESRRQMEETQRQMEESQRQMEASQRQRDEMMDRMAHAIAPIQAGIIRIDETR
jgi:uncharacterized membrane-anchored protein YhcB (DUF1043 family)